MRILRQMANELQGRRAFDYNKFKDHLEVAKRNFVSGQSNGMQLHLDNLESFLDMTQVKSRKANPGQDVFWADPGTLTVVDLTDPFLDSATACVLFQACLELFLEHPAEHGFIFALDEAHEVSGQSCYVFTSACADKDAFHERYGFRGQSGRQPVDRRP